MNSALCTDAEFNESDLARRIVIDIKEIFSSMVGRDDLDHLPDLIDPVTPLENCVSAMVGMIGSYNGIVCLHTPKHLALDFASGMLGMDVAEVENEIHDAMGEIANMIAGVFKQHLSSGGLDIRLSTPSVATHEEYCITAGGPDGTLSLGFAAANKLFVVSASLKRQ